MVNSTANADFQTPARTAFIVSFFWLPAVISVCLNSFIIVISLKKDVISGRYKVFICYLAIYDLSASFGLCFIQPLITWGSTDMYWSLACDLNGTFYWFGSQGMYIALTLIALNRYISVCANDENLYDRVYTKRNITFMFIVPFLFSLLIGPVYFIDSYYYGKHPLPPYATICVGFLKIKSPLVALGHNISGAVTVPASVATCVMVWLIHKKIKSHTNQVQDVLNEQRMLKNQNLLKALKIQMFLSLIGTIPAAIHASLAGVLPTAANIEVQQMTLVLLSANPMFDAITTLLVTTAYRRVATNWFANIKSGNCVLQDPGESE